MATSPDVQNYHIGKGIVSFKETAPTVAVGFVDLGNAPSFVWEPTIEKLEHFSSREGVKTKDFTAVTQTGATITFTLDEITPETIRLFTLGEIGAGVGGEITIDAFKNTEISGDIQMVGTNDIGQQVTFTAAISIIPSGAFSMITAEDEFTTLELTAEVQRDAVEGTFGKFTFPAPEVLAMEGGTRRGARVRAKDPATEDATAP